jgi:hypothetical protein
VVVLFIILVVLAITVAAVAVVAVVGRGRRHQAEQPHARAMEALGRMQQPRGAVPARATRPPGAAPSSPHRAAPHLTSPRRRSHRRRAGALAGAVGVLVALNLVAGAVLALSLAGPGKKDQPGTEAQPPSTTSPTSLPPSTTGTAHSVTSSTAPTSSSLPPPPLGGAPVLATISPASGIAGQVVTLTGTGLFSADGVITVAFGSAPASVVCPTETTCRATVPTRPAASSGTVSVTVKTQSGTSNRVAFSYS